MCIAVHQPPGKIIDQNTLENCWDNNPDGAGFMYATKGKIVVFKEMHSFQRFWNAYSAAMSGAAQGKDVVLHFRISTGGKIDRANCHPHRVHDDLAFVHNGILAYPSSKKFSDTVLFNKDILQGLPKDFLESSEILHLIEMAAGTDKLVFLDSTGFVVILNKGLGVEDNGIWYSNRAYAYASYNKNWENDWEEYENGWRAGRKTLVPYKSSAMLSNPLTELVGSPATTCLACGKGLAPLSHTEMTTGICDMCLIDFGFAPQQNTVTAKGYCGTCNHSTFVGEQFFSWCHKCQPGALGYIRGNKEQIEELLDWDYEMVRRSGI